MTSRRPKILQFLNLLKTSNAIHSITDSIKFPKPVFIYVFIIALQHHTYKITRLVFIVSGVEGQMATIATCPN